MGNHLEKKHIEFPADWWQAFKDSFFPEWLLKIFPVIHKRVEITFDVLYPDFKPALPDERMIWRQSIHETHDRK